MNNQGVILAMNETAALRLGKRREELVGLVIDDILPTEVAKARER
jgi:PAS domain-containing protein